MKAFARAAVVTVGIGSAISLFSPSAYAANPCDYGALCVYEDPGYGGSRMETQGNIGNWSGAGGVSAALENKDSSWKNRYGSWYWACVYNYDWYTNVTAWIARGDSLPRAGSGMYVNKGSSNQGLSSSSASC